MKKKNIIVLTAVLTASVALAACVQNTGNTSTTATSAKTAVSVEKQSNTWKGTEEVVEDEIETPKVESGEENTTEQVSDEKTTSNEETVPVVEENVVDVSSESETIVDENVAEVSSEPETTADEAEEKPWLKYGITDEEFAQIKPWELYNPNITKEQYYEMAPWEATTLSEVEYTCYLYYSRPLDLYTDEQKEQYRQRVIDHYLIDDYYTEILEQLVPGAVDLVNSYADDVLRTPRKYKRFDEIFDYEWYLLGIDSNKARKIFEYLPSLYYRYGKLNKYAYLKMIDSIRTHGTGNYYEEAVAGGVISENDKKLTVDDIKKIVKESKTIDQVWSAVKAIQPYCDVETRWSRIYLPEGTWEKERIAIYYSYGTAYVVTNESRDADEEILATYYVAEDPIDQLSVPDLKNY